ncbi:MAG: hypothetical protein DRI54_07395, partial [Bacteroidetes bacterium]
MDNLVVTDESCEGALDGQIDITGIGGTAPLEYLIDGVLNIPSTSGVFAGLGLGNYTITIQDANSCFIDIAVTIGETNDLIITTNSTTDVCVGNSDGIINVTGSGGMGAYDYYIDAVINVPSTSGVFNGLTAGTYTISFEDANGCTESTSITINTRGPFTYSTSELRPLCNGDSNGELTITATGPSAPYQFELLAPDIPVPLTGLQASVTYGGLSAGGHNVYMVDSYGCNQTVNITTTQPSQISTSVNSGDIYGVTCNGYANGGFWIKIWGGTPIAGIGYKGRNYDDPGNPGGWINALGFFGSKYVWLGGLSGGVHTIQVIDDNGCTVLRNVTISEPPLLTATNAVSNIGCGGGNGSITINASGGTPGYSYNLNPGPVQGSNVFGGLLAGTYDVIVSDSENCSFIINNIVVNVANPLDISLNSVTQPNCDLAANGSITVDINDGATPITLSATGQPAVVINGPLPKQHTFSGLLAGTYTVTASSGVCTDQIINIVLTNIDDLDLQLGPVTDVSCPLDSDGSINVIVSGGVPGYTYTLNPGAIDGGPTFNGLSPGAYIITVTDGVGCQSSVGGSILSASPLEGGVVSVGNVLCDDGVSTGSVTVSGTAGIPPFQYSDGGAFQLNPVFTGLLAGNYTFFVMDATGCVAEFPVTIGQLNAIIVTVLSIIEPTCNGFTDGAISLNTSNGVTPYEYSLVSDFSVLEPSSLILNLPAGTTTIYVRDQNNCKATVDEPLTEPDILTAVVSDIPVPVECSESTNAQVEVTVSGGTPNFEYSIDGGGFVAGGNPYIFTLLDQGAHTYKILDANLCEFNTGSFNLPVTDSEAPNMICQNITVQLDASGNVSIVPADIDNGSTDNCLGLVLSLNVTDFTCADIGANAVVLTGTDAEGNIANCNATVTVQDVSDPIMACQNITVQLDGTGNVSIVPADIDNGSSDVCVGLTLSLDITDFTCADIGANAVVLTGTDDQGNAATCNATVTVEDNVDPVMACQNITVQLDGTGNVSIVPADVDNGSADNCVGLALSLDI